MKLLFLLALCLLFAPMAYASTWYESFDSDLFRWREIVNAQSADFALPCRNTGELRTEWQVQKQMAHLGIVDSLPCKVGMVLDIPELAGLKEYSLSFRFTYTGSAVTRTWYVQWQDAGTFLAIHFDRGKLYPEKRVDGTTYWVGHPREWAVPEDTSTSLQIVYSLSRRSIEVFQEHELLHTFREYEGQPQIQDGVPGLAVDMDGRKLPSHTWYDDFRVTELGPHLQLPVPFLSQADPRWSDHIYDRADIWSPLEPEIKRWGCALVSAAMVFRSHGLVTLPSGEELSPASLNAWLQNQPDGYIGLGLVNWWALSRLSWQISEQYGTPKLEFNRVEPPDGDKLHWLHERLTLGLPVILEQPGHFVVATGYRSASEFSIADPYYDRFSLEPYGQRYLSARLFRPSKTDLSTVVIAVPEAVELRFLNESGVQLTAESWIEEPVIDPLGQRSSGESLRFFVLDKPDSERLTVQTLAVSTSPQIASIYAYQSNGSVSTRKWFLLAGEQGEVTLQYSKQAPTQFILDEHEVTLDQNDLLPFLETQALRSPLLLKLILEWQAELRTASTLQTAEALLRKDYLLLGEALGGNWISASLLHQIRQIFQALVHRRFP